MHGNIPHKGKVFCGLELDVGGCILVFEIYPRDYLSVLTLKQHIAFGKIVFDNAERHNSIKSGGILVAGINYQ